MLWLYAVFFIYTILNVDTFLLGVRQGFNPPFPHPEARTSLLHDY